MADEWLGRAINDYLVERGIKQIFLAKKTGIPRHKLCNSLNGKRRITFEEYELICGALDVNTDEFIKPKKL